VLSPIIPNDAHFTLTQLEEFGSAFEVLPAAGRLPRLWWTHSSRELSASAKTFETASSLASDFSTKQEQLRAYISLSFPEAAELLSAIDTKFQTWYSRLSPAFWKWRSELKGACKPGSRLDHTTIRSYCGIARSLVEMQRWFDQHANELAQEVVPTDLKKPEQLTRIAAQFRVAEKLQKALSAGGVQAAVGCEELTREMQNAATHCATRFLRGMQH
jgi:hypothetical protein